MQKTEVSRPIKTLKNIEAVRASILLLRKHADTFSSFDHSVIQIHTKNLHYHAYKLAIVQRFCNRDFN